jgi:hypothetical protein
MITVVSFFECIYLRNRQEEWEHPTSVCVNYFLLNYFCFDDVLCLMVFYLYAYEQTAEELSTRRPETLKIRLVSKTDSGNLVKKNVDFLRILFGKRMSSLINGYLKNHHL